MGRPPYRPLNLAEPEVGALEIVLEDYLKDRQSTVLSRVGDIYIRKVLNKIRRLK